jgi:hypothetical protein
MVGKWWQANDASDMGDPTSYCSAAAAVVFLTVAVASSGLHFVAHCRWTCEIVAGVMLATEGRTSCGYGSCHFVGWILWDGRLDVKMYVVAPTAGGNPVIVGSAHE